MAQLLQNLQSTQGSGGVEQLMAPSQGQLQVLQAPFETAIGKATSTPRSNFDLPANPKTRSSKG